jgi:hypothetical protein
LFIICICGENATVFVDFTKKSDLTPGLKADIYSSRRVLKTPGVETIFISRRVLKTPGVETIFISRRVSKTPGVETASEFRNTRDILSLLNSWIKSA